MKPDNDPLFGQSTLLCMHDSKPFEYNNAGTDTAELEAIMKENRNGALHDLNSSENDAARLTSEINYKDGLFNAPELERERVVEDSTNGNDNEVSGSVAPCTICSNSNELFERGMDFYREKNGIENEVRNELEFRESGAPCTIPSRKTDLIDTDSYIDKNVLECELPEFLVCYKDNTYHVVKDICIDEGLPSMEKVLIECGEEKGLCTIPASNGNKYEGMTQGEEIELLSHSGSKSSSEDSGQEVDTYECGNKEEIVLLRSSGAKSSSENGCHEAHSYEYENKEEIGLHSHSGSKSSSEDGCHEVDTYECGNKDEIELLSPSGSKSSSENDCHEVDTYERGTKEKVEPELLTSDELKSSAENECEDNFGNDGGSLVLVQTVEGYNATDTIGDRLSTEASLRSLLESSECNNNEVERQSPQIPCSQVPCESPSVVPAPDESNKSNAVNDLSYNSRVESGTITFHFNPLTHAANDDIDHEQPLKMDNEPKHEDVISNSLAVETGYQRDQGESSLSMAGSVSGRLITYSGPITFSGSVSLRSESSTTSTRSFAFPVLQNEWNSSPIRMAKADRRHYRRHRGWMQGLLCCQGLPVVPIVTLPRKLRLIEEATSTTLHMKVNGGSKDHSSSNKQLTKGTLSGKMHARGSGTRQEWTERIDSSNFFTMDYSQVRRRRPIHNKSLPVGP